MTAMGHLKAQDIVVLNTGAAHHDETEQVREGGMQGEASRYSRQAHGVEY
jgi:hypothetical protein